MYLYACVRRHEGMRADIDASGSCPAAAAAAFCFGDAPWRPPLLATLLLR